MILYFLNAVFQPNNKKPEVEWKQGSSLLWTTQ